MDKRFLFRVEQLSSDSLYVPAHGILSGRSKRAYNIGQDPHTIPVEMPVPDALFEGHRFIQHMRGTNMPTEFISTTQNLYRAILIYALAKQNGVSGEDVTLSVIDRDLLPGPPINPKAIFDAIPLHRRGNNPVNQVLTSTYLHRRAQAIVNEERIIPIVIPAAAMVSRYTFAEIEEFLPSWLYEDYDERRFHTVTFDRMVRTWYSKVGKVSVRELYQDWADAGWVKSFESASEALINFLIPNPSGISVPARSDLIESFAQPPSVDE